MKPESDITTTFNATLKTYYHGKLLFGDKIIQQQRSMRQGIESWWCNSMGDEQCTIFDTGKVTGRFVVEKIIKIPRSNLARRDGLKVDIFLVEVP